MLWHTELALNLALCIYLAVSRDGRPRFEAWVWCRFIFDSAQMLAERTGYNAIATNVWYLGVIAGAGLLLLALHEAVRLDRWHRGILFAWVSLSMAAAWIRFFLYTGRAVLVIDGAAFICWIGAKMLQRRV